MYKCDICEKESENVVAGRWFFYCKNNSNCQAKELQAIRENELSSTGDFLADESDFDYLLENPDLHDLIF